MWLFTPTEILSYFPFNTFLEFAYPAKEKHSFRKPWAHCSQDFGVCWLEGNFLLGVQRYQIMMRNNYSHRWGADSSSCPRVFTEQRRCSVEGEVRGHISQAACSGPEPLRGHTGMETTRNQGKQMKRWPTRRWCDLDIALLTHMPSHLLRKINECYWKETWE